MITEACIEAPGYRDAWGYGRKKLNGKSLHAHRAAWIQAYGPLTSEMFVCHHCDNPGCINLNHLFVGTVADNNHDRDAKGRHWNMKKTHCPKGHPYSAENTRRGNGRRHCRACRSLQWQDRRLRLGLGPTPPPKLVADDVKQIKAAMSAGVRNAELARQFGVSNGLISMIKTGRVWSSVTLEAELDSSKSVA